MAPKSSSKPKGEGKQGLVVTLVFFILATIGLGISTYTGYTADEGKAAALKKTEGEKKAMEADRDWWKFQTMLCQSYMGLLRGEEQAELAVKKDQFDQNQLGPEKEREPLRTLIKQNLEPKFKWDAAQKKFDKSYESLLVEERNRQDALEKQVAALRQEKDRAEQRAKAAEDLQKTADANYQAELAKLTKKLETDNADLVKRKDELLKDITSLGQEKEALRNKMEAEGKVLMARVDKLNKDVKELRAQLEAKDMNIAQIQLKGADAPKDWRTDWKIVSIDSRGDTVYINLGSADKVQEQLTFSIHGLGTDRKPLPVSKGSLEVINVVSEHLSQARITGAKDRFKDPILKGDILFNPSWNPTLKKHVAVTGVVDLTGDGRDSVVEFMRNLERNNIVIDAWLDVKDNMTIKGKGISVQTDYLIIGDGQENMTDNSATIQFRKDLDAKIDEMRADAKKNGVQIIGVRKYLELIGYRLPRPLSDRPATYRPIFTAPGAPVAPANPKEPKGPMDPMKNDKPPAKEDKAPAPAPAKEDKGM